MDTSQLFWMIPLTLFVLAIVQIIYLFWLRFAPTRQRTTRHIDSPIMPTVPQGGIPSQGTQSDSGAKMSVISGLPAREIRLQGQYVGIGRYHDPRNNIHVSLDEKSVSRRHAIIQYDDAYMTYFVSDTQSTYGTYIRHGTEFRRIEADKRERIYDDDVVRFGHSVTVRFELPGDHRGHNNQS